MGVWVSFSSISFVLLLDTRPFVGPRLIVLNRPLSVLYIHTLTSTLSDNPIFTLFTTSFLSFILAEFLINCLEISSSHGFETCCI